VVVVGSVGGIDALRVTLPKVCRLKYVVADREISPLVHSERVLELSDDELSVVVLLVVLFFVVLFLVDVGVTVSVTVTVTVSSGMDVDGGGGDSLTVRESCGSGSLGSMVAV
jgi:hypothetical protein